MSDILNIALIVVMSILAVIMFYRFFKIRGRVMIKDQQWSYVRILFLFLGVMSIMSFVTAREVLTMLDFARIIITVFAVSGYMLVRDGVGETGVTAGGKFYPWSEVRGWDYHDAKRVVEMYFMIESQNDKKPDNYTTKELDFSQEDREYLMRFMELNCSRKYMRMKKNVK